MEFEEAIQSLKVISDHDRFKRIISLVNVIIQEVIELNRELKLNKRITLSILSMVCTEILSKIKRMDDRMVAIDVIRASLVLGDKFPSHKIAKEIFTKASKSKNVKV